MGRRRARRSRLSFGVADLLSPAAVRPEGGAVLDLHVHTSDFSRDAGASGRRVAEQAAIRGLDGICLTEHNSRWSDARAEALADEHGIVVIPAMEIGTDVGHVLAFGLPHFSHELVDIERLHAIARHEGAALVLAHPMRPFHGRRTEWTERERWFDGLEVINGDQSDSNSGYYVRTASERGFAAVGGSDVHSVAAVGRVVTVFEAPVRDVGDLIDHILARTTAAADLRPTRSTATPGSA